MGSNQFLIVILPLIAYVLIEMRMGYKAGMVAAVAISLGLVGYEYFSFGEVDNMTVMEVVLIMGMALVSYFMDNDKFLSFNL